MQNNQQSTINNQPQKVVVAMSGGVDSSVTAALLKQQGYEVIGITMQVWPKDQTQDDGCAKTCCSLSAVEDARSVATKLDISYYVLNFREIFKDKVISNFINEYQNGRTPNPCIRCNDLIKFEALLQKARGLGADFLATGHYAQIAYDKDSNRYELLKGEDEIKDQSYFLYTMNQEQLASVLFPLGSFTKDKSRKMAEELGLRVANKPESQEICFVPDNDYREFLSSTIKDEEGPILDVEGNRLGTHQGVAGFTVGQRKGLRVSHAEPLYVVSINKEENSIIAGTKKYLYKKSLLAFDANWITIEKLEKSIKAHVQIRYNMSPKPALIEPDGDKVKVIFDEPVSSITPGQAVVFYDQNKVIGGATIEKSL